MVKMVHFTCIFTTTENKIFLKRNSNDRECLLSVTSLISFYGPNSPARAVLFSHRFYTQESGGPARVRSNLPGTTRLRAAGLHPHTVRLQKTRSHPHPHWGKASQSYSCLHKTTARAPDTESKGPDSVSSPATC